MGCNCGSKNRAATAGATPGTYRVMVDGGSGSGQRQVYESHSKDAADTVASRFANATVLAPGETS